MAAVPPATPQNDSRIGSVLNGRYRIVASLAKGSMGTVYRGERLGIGRAVAVKFLHMSIAGDRQFTRRFEREAMAMSRLSHPHTVPVIDFGVDGNTPYVVMELCDGKPLSEILEAGALDAARAIRLVSQILAGLEHTHERDIVHRDVKPANVIITEYPGIGEHARLVDFGLAKMPRLASDLTETQIAVGTPSYMSPEQTRGDMVDPRADIYGVGVLLFRMLTGKRPFDADDTATMLMFHREAPVPQLAARSDKDFSPELEAVVARALAKSPCERFSSALLFSQALANCPEAAGLVPRRRKATRKTSRVLPGSRHSRTAAILAAACIVVCWFSFQNEPKTAAPLTLSKNVEQPADEKVAAPLTVTMPTIVTIPQKQLPPVTLPMPVVVPVPVPVPVPEQQELAAPVITPSEPTVIASPSPPPAIDPPLHVTAPPATDLLPSEQGDQAIATLEALRRSQPESAYLPYLLGRLYAERGDYKNAVAQYKDAIAGRREYRRHPRVSKALIQALGSPDTRFAAQRLLIRDVKRAAVPYLLRAKKSDPDPTIRTQAERVLERIRAGS